MSSIFTPPEKQYAGYIFDCDGTLANSMPVHYSAWKDTFGKYGGKFDEPLFYSLGGVPTPKIVSILNEKFGTSMDPLVASEEKERLYVDRMTAIRPIEEVCGFAREVAKFAKVSVASGGVLPVVAKTLEVIGFKDFFPVILTAEQVIRGKPFPDMFLEAAYRMGVKPEECLVLEDSPAGFEAATAAGMDYAVVGRPTFGA
jgi:HAD superfamily hydrolase (TIGR01509 family)